MSLHGIIVAYNEGIIFDTIVARSIGEATVYGILSGQIVRSITLEFSDRLDIVLPLNPESVDHVTILLAVLLRSNEVVYWNGRVLTTRLVRRTRLQQVINADTLPTDTLDANDHLLRLIDEVLVRDQQILRGEATLEILPPELGITHYNCNVLCNILHF